MIAKSAVVMIGTPAGVNGTKASESAIAAPAMNRVLVSTNRGQTNPMKAAGTAASNPHADGFPIAFAPSAPRSVKIFQNTKTPKPVCQKPVT